MAAAARPGAAGTDRVGAPVPVPGRLRYAPPGHPMATAIRRFHVDHLHQPSGWLSPAFVTLDDAGVIARVDDAPPEGWDPGDALRLKGFAVPGVPDLHSHAFQRALVGRGEANAPGRDDSFWTWRQAMYAVAAEVSPEALEAVAAWLYVELLEGGFTSVGEFHYLHHDPAGRPYDDPAEMSRRILSAAGRAGIGLTLLPVLYRRGGFDRPAEPGQRRFLSPSLEGFLGLLEAIDTAAAGTGARVGVAAHSLRAVAPEEVVALAAATGDRPFHVHVAEQQAEVDACVAHLGARPVAWLLDRAPVDGRWCLVHATHLDADERRRLAASGAVAGLCPTTEANLGDGIFPARDFLAEGGAVGVGTDSQVGASAAAELGLLELTQRLRDQGRNRLAQGDRPETLHLGRRLLDLACAGGARALGLDAGALVPGRRADVVVLDPEHPRLVAHGESTVLDAWVLGGAEGAVSDVLVGGVHQVAGGRHRHREAIRARFAETLRALARRL